MFYRGIRLCWIVIIFFFNDTATTEIYTYCHTLSLHDALPIYPEAVDGQHRLAPAGRPRPAFGRHGEGEQRAARQAQAGRPPAAQPGHLAEDVRQAEVPAAQQVALAEAALLEGKQVHGGDVVELHKVEASVDEGRDRKREV